MKKALCTFKQHLENRLLQILLARFAGRQIEASSWRSSELVDFATVIIDTVAP